jgi:hypothetical protein
MMLGGLGIMSKPLQVYLDEADLERLDAFARERGWTKSQAIRAAIRALTRPPAEDYLNETYVAETPAPYRVRRCTRPPVRR